MATIVKVVNGATLANKQDAIDIYSNLIISCCNNRDYVDGYHILTVFPQIVL